MQNVLKIVSIFALIVAIGGGAGYLLCLAMAPSDASVESVEIVAVKKSAKTTVVAKAKKATAKKVEIKVSQELPIQPAENLAGEILPAENDEAEEDELNPQQRAIMEELQLALDNENLKGVQQALAKFSMKTSRGGLGGAVPKCMRRRAVEALGWFGKAAAVDLIGCMADVDVEIASEATSQFEQVLQDAEMSTAERAQLLTGVMKALVDVDTIDSLLFNLNDLPNSLKADAVEKILTTGSPAAQSVMTEQLEFYLDEEVKSVSDITRWKIENPDD